MPTFEIRVKECGYLRPGEMFARPQAITYLRRISPYAKVAR